MLKDLIHGARTLMRDKGWTAVVVLSLALGIGANTALFSAVNGLFLKKLDGPRSRLAGAAEVGRQERHGHRLQRLRLLGEGRRRPERPQRRSPTRCSSSSSPTTARWTISWPARRTAASTSSSTARPTSPVPSSRPATTTACSACTRIPGRTIAPERRSAGRAAGRGDQRALLALALRRRSRASSARSCR